MELQELIFKHLTQQQESRLITLDKTEPYFAENHEYQDYISDIKERLKIKLKTGKCSNILVEQLAKHRCNLGEPFGKKVEFYNASELCELIELIELGKVDGEPFNGDILRGFHKTHHDSYSSHGYSIVRNIQEYWFKNNKMEKRLKVIEFDKKQNLLDYVNTNLDKLNVLSISTSQVSYDYKHFLWYYDK